MSLCEELSLWAAVLFSMDQLPGASHRVDVSPNPSGFRVNTERVHVHIECPVGTVLAIDGFTLQRKTRLGESRVLSKYLSVVKLFVRVAGTILIALVATAIMVRQVAETFATDVIAHEVKGPGLSAAVALGGMIEWNVSAHENL